MNDESVNPPIEDPGGDISDPVILRWFGFPDLWWWLK